MISRGDIFWVDLGEITDHTPAKQRPVVVIQSDEKTRSRIGTVVVITITSNTARADFLGNVLVRAEESGLPKDSVVVPTEVVTLDRHKLVDFAGRLPLVIMREVDAGLRLALSL